MKKEVQTKVECHGASGAIYFFGIVGSAITTYQPQQVFGWVLWELSNRFSGQVFWFMKF